MGCGHLQSCTLFISNEVGKYHGYKIFFYLITMVNTNWNVNEMKMNFSTVTISLILVLVLLIAGFTFCTFNRRITTSLMIHAYFRLRQWCAGESHADGSLLHCVIQWVTDITDRRHIVTVCSIHVYRDLILCSKLVELFSFCSDSDCQTPWVTYVVCLCLTLATPSIYMILLLLATFSTKFHDLTHIYFTLSQHQLLKVNQQVIRQWTETLLTLIHCVQLNAY